MKLTFISYDGSFPNLCSGTLVLAIDGKEVEFPPYCLCSGGSVFTDCDEGVIKGLWSIEKFPEDFPDELKAEAEKLVNCNVPSGCCGGCL